MSLTSMDIIAQEIPGAFAKGKMPFQNLIARFEPLGVDRSAEPFEVGDPHRLDNIDLSAMGPSWGPCLEPLRKGDGNKDP